jgi:plastocyanin
VAGGSGFAFKDFAGCTFDTAVDATTIDVSGFKYSPACIKVKAGDMVSLPGMSGHPLAGMVTNGDQPNPISSGQPAGGYTSTVKVTFPDQGSFGFYCVFHGSDTTSGGSMTGVVYVQ